MSFQNPFPGLDKPLNRQDLISAIRLDIAAENEATFLYQSHAQACQKDFPEVAEILRDIATEEIVHTGELTEVLRSVSLDGILLDQGKDEVKKKFPDLEYKVGMIKKEFRYDMDDLKR